MLKGIATHPMMSVHHHKWVPYEMLKSKDRTDFVRIGGRILLHLNIGLHVNGFEDDEYFSTSKLVKNTTYEGNNCMYSYNTRTRGFVFLILAKTLTKTQSWMPTRQVPFSLTSVRWDSSQWKRIVYGQLHFTCRHKIALF